MELDKREIEWLKLELAGLVPLGDPRAFKFDALCDLAVRLSEQPSEPGLARDTLGRIAEYSDYAGATRALQAVKGMARSACAVLDLRPPEPSQPTLSADGGREVGWLVENGQSGEELRYRTIVQGLPAWTADHNEAIRFARRVDAEKFAAEDEDAWRIAEHIWDAPNNERAAPGGGSQPVDGEHRIPAAVVPSRGVKAGQISTVPVAAPTVEGLSEELEELAALEHEQWMEWARSIARSEPFLTEGRKERWAKAMVPYSMLTEEQKEQDRIWARKVLAIRTRASAPEWIPVGERLPELDDLVIANTVEYGPLLADRSTSNPQHGWSCDGEVTHWMPLPAAPGGEMSEPTLRGELLKQLHFAASVGLDLSPGDRLCGEAYREIRTLELALARRDALLRRWMKRAAPIFDEDLKLDTERELGQGG